MRAYKILEHKADLKIKVWGNDLSDLFKNAAYAMYAAMDGSLSTPDYKLQNIKVSGQDYESLLINFLNELLYLSDVNNRMYKVESVEIVEDEKIKLKAALSPFSPPPSEIEIKGATYHNLKIKKMDAGFETTIVFDI